MAGSKNRHGTEFGQPGSAGLIAQTLAAFLKPRLLLGARLCVGLSGGLDSVVLVHALDRLRRTGVAVELSAVHVHHGLSANADAWATFCSDFCRSRGVPLAVVRAQVPDARGEGLEAAARGVRHAVFANCSADWLALAHHLDDQAETVLFRLLRGAGVGGAAGMPAERSQAAGPRLIRPLLDVARSEIARYAEEHSLAWIEDESNADCRYRRNHLRRQVIPRITEIFPGAPQALARAARLFSEAAALLEELASADRGATTSTQGRIDLARFSVLSAPRARNLLRWELRNAGFRAPDERWLDEALRQLSRVGASSQTCVATRDGELHAYRGELHVVVRREPIPQVAVLWNGELALPWGGDRVSFARTVGSGISHRLLVGASVCLRSRQGGERLRPDPRRPARSLRKVLQEAAVPPWERARLPLLWCGERLAWVGGVGVDAAFACAPGEEGLVPLWEAGGGPPPAGFKMAPA
ncbi:MAG TPA: tRNA lysidine(34) synthetase TilS [Accumulibacter sp.]|uniref:tRNA lysidine(34) synthetase TilS n=1 Tax=Accumulibacter sp. TaxID=2053492 RepID=UPI002BC0B412|nr:tRNA lysidine(34) synthetase TilS [Accumulibacter sp.]HRF71695.1 tRNA lysidine(34) synthetase TilS [Accumulibacter sp.]